MENGDGGAQLRQVHVIDAVLCKYDKTQVKHTYI